MKITRTPKGAARSAAPLGRRRRRRLVVFHLVRISYVFASFLEPVLTPGIIFSPGRINFLIRAGENFIINVWGYSEIDINWGAAAAPRPPTLSYNVVP